MKTNILAVAAFVAMTAGAAKAQENNWPCKADADKFCKGVEPGGGRILACLKQHQADLSTQCKARGLQRKVETDPAAELCRTDLDKFCPDVKGGPAEKIRCLKEHQKDLSANCEAKLRTLPKKDPCKTDTARFCKGLKPGSGRLISCLKRHEANLSENCKADMAAKTAELQKKNPCFFEMEKFCRNVKPGGGRIIACLKAHQAYMSDGCKAGLDRIKEHRLGAVEEGKDRPGNSGNVPSAGQDGRQPGGRDSAAPAAPENN